MRKIFIRINLNVQEFKKNKDERFEKEWIEKRLDIFMGSNFKSLIAQKNQNFTAKVIYEDSSYEIVHNWMRKYPKLPQNIILQKKSEDFIRKGEICTEDEVLIVRLDSDDMYRNNVIDGLMKAKIKENQEAILYQNGYIYD